MKNLFKLSPFILLGLILFSTGTQMTSCVKETIIRDTVTITKRDTLNKTDTLTIIDSSSCYDLKDGLVAWYNFNNGSTKDSSGYNNHIVFNNATLVADRSGRPNRAFQFNGTNNYMRIQNSPSLNMTNKISLFALIKVNGFYYGTCHGNWIIMKGEDGPPYPHYTLNFDDNYITNAQNCFINIPDTLRQTISGTSTFNPVKGYYPYVQKNKWYNLIYTCDGITAKLFIDGELISEGEASAVNFTNSSDLFLGRLNDVQYPYWFNGVMDEIRVYNKALCAGEIKALNGLKD